MPGAAVVVVVSSARPPAWQRRVLALVEAAGTVEVVGVRVGRAEELGAWLRLVRRVEGRLFGAAPDALAPGPVALRAPPAATRALPVHLDGEPGPEGDAVWVVHGAGGTLEDCCATAIASGHDGVMSEVRLRRAGRTTVVAATVSGIRPYAGTPAANQVRWKLAGMVVRVVRALPDAPAAAPLEPIRTVARGARAPRPVRWVRALAIRLLHRRPWRLRVRVDRPGALHEGWDAPSLVGARRGHLYADPFLVEHGGAVHLFCEEVPRGARLGRISHVELGRPGAVPTPVMRAPHHLSYPFLLEDQGQLLMVPETASAGRVELWRATRFPDEWTLDHVLMEDVALADATLLRHEGRWWLFGTVAAPGASLLDELYLFLADELRGPWTPHPANPVVSDVRCARPAGPLLRQGGMLVRPAQDGGRRYGGALVLREITTLTPERYAERALDRLGPEEVPGARGVHHYCRAAGYEAIDLRIRERRHPWGRGS